MLPGLLDQHQLAALVQRRRPRFHDLIAKQRERAAVRPVEFEADRFTSVPEPPSRCSGEHGKASGDPPVLSSAEAVRDPVHLTTSQLDAPQLSVMFCTLCIHH